MLALLLENWEVEDITARGIFLEKIKENEILRSDLKKAVAIPSESILFNIDQKADVISKQEMDTLLAVFIKVFDEHCGYYGKLPFVAQFERDLDQDGLLQDFISEVEARTGKDWPWIRRREKRMAKAIDEAYSRWLASKYKASSTSTATIIAFPLRTLPNRSMPTSFAKVMISAQLLVDEVGQYIAGNTKS